MTKDEFLKHLGESPTNEIKIKCLQYFVDNYPVQISETKSIQTPFGDILSIPTGRKVWTSLPGYNVTKDKMAMQYVEENFNKLKQRIVEIKDFK